MFKEYTRVSSTKLSDTYFIKWCINTVVSGQLIILLTLRLRIFVKFCPFLSYFNVKVPILIGPVDVSMRCNKHK